jgi:hypothetical protein
MRRSRIALSVCLALVPALSIGPAALSQAKTEKLAKGPVVCNVKTDRATLLWVTQRTAGEVRPENGGTPIAVEEPVYHQVELKGLSYGTRYTYDLGAWGVDAKGSFVTAAAGDTPFSFLVFGDTRTRHDFHRKVALRMATEKSDFVLHTGDLVANGQSSDDWDRFFEIEKELLRGTTFFPTLGNHDRNNGDIFSKYFAFPGGDVRHYSFDWGPVHVATVDSNEWGTTAEDRAAYRREMLAWLKEDLRRNRKALTFVFFHHPLYSAVEARKGSASKLAEQFEPILLEAGVTAVFAGHDHNYQHHVAKGLHHIVTGGGGAPLYEVDPIPQITLKAAKIENYVRVKVSGTTAKVEAIDLDGKLLESFEMSGRVVPPPTASAR